ncbi:ribosome small subunit-dependent GTPase A [Sinomicrobium weinanense]|uniref:Small ribosomal subunit biogenesis GTPase RsgA n=1 Tax=Sinomicrobium weinanense TaxID=2842200 RepID=A0A926JRX2_9FLAO|nr:ribosome small subunit-dependent GTPase A [Sinomicrobium weinanense]MBC9796184.1 ribosome small subunit-dependent GTPase A [Sinomicrobium weinanense]MBU3123463.1 ribosome small subunit-dependent GTPase A [Sinomicrobium weinanense]
MTGTVYKSTGSWYTVKTAEGQVYECRIKGKFRIKGIKSTSPVTVGDVVDFESESENSVGTGVITHIHDRMNYIVRRSVNLSKQKHIIAANIDQAFLLVTLKNPLTLTTFIDRFLITAEAYDIRAVLVFSKADQYDEEELLEVKYLAAMYRQIGYECIGVSTVTGKNVDQVKELMKGKVSMFSGHSGVGKSTLVNAIAPKLNLRTAKISEQHKQGQHTTTFAEMFDLDFGAKIIDTPGIKGFGIIDMEKEEIGDYFPEFFALKSECRFNNCLHVDEPHCAVKQALEDGEILWSRYKSYLQILEGEEESYRTDIYGEE